MRMRTASLASRRVDHRFMAFAVHVGTDFPQYREVERDSVGLSPASRLAIDREHVRFIDPARCLVK